MQRRATQHGTCERAKFAIFRESEKAQRYILPINCAATNFRTWQSGRVSIIDGDHRMQDLIGDSEDSPAAAVFGCASVRVDCSISRDKPASSAASAQSENDLDAAAAVVGSTVLGAAVWFALALWLI